MAVNQQLVALQSLLESGAHEDITSSSIGKDGQVNPEEEQIDEDGPGDQRGRPSIEMLPEVLLCENQHTAVADT